MIEKSLDELNFASLTQRDYYASPLAWEDQVLYFLMLDRFSDNQEKDYFDNDGNSVHSGNTPKFHVQDTGNAVQNVNAATAWREAGGKWVGGNLKGLTSKIGYLKRMGITAIWISPIFKQISFQDTYHGYGIQNFIDVDHHFGTRQDLKHLVSTAHKHGIYVILDIILNHSGNVFDYNPDRYKTKNNLGQEYLDPRWDGNPYAVKGWNDAQGQTNLPFNQIDLTMQPDAWPDCAIWPTDFQQPDFFTRKGRINNWEYHPEFVEGDFLDLKDIHLGNGSTDNYRPSTALRALATVYKYWIAYADLDGFRVDTVKHMDMGATRFFTSVIREFCQRIGKENFYLIGEITGGRKRAVETMEATGLNAALGIADIPDKLEYLVKGYRNPADYFSLFRNSLLVKKDSHVWFKDKVVTVLDDHDQVRKGENKARFCADDPGKKLILNVLALNVTTLGIPCIYYGSEQAFDGHGGNDRYIRESMFGGSFGAFRTHNRHFFDEQNPVYSEFGKILKIRASEIILRRGRQYLRQISADGYQFDYPHILGEHMRSIVAWSRIFDDKEILLALNTDVDQTRSAWTIIDNDLHKPNDVFTVIYSTDATQINTQFAVQNANPHTLAINLTVPAAGFVILKQV